MGQCYNVEYYCGSLRHFKLSFFVKLSALAKWSKSVILLLLHMKEIHYHRYAPSYCELFWRIFLVGTKT